MNPTLLDTDILSHVLKRKNPLVVQRAAAYLQQYGKFSYAIISHFEILRGLKARGAVAQLRRFAVFRQKSELLSLTEAIVERAAELYADLWQRGQLIGDADLLIAATALEHQRILSTANVRDFQRISGLVIDDWTKP